MLDTSEDPVQIYLQFAFKMGNAELFLINTEVDGGAELPAGAL